MEDIRALRTAKALEVDAPTLSLAKMRESYSLENAETK